MTSSFHVAFFLSLTGGLLISGTWSSNIQRRYAGCPPGWRQKDSRCFIIQTSRKTMVDAEQACIDLGGNLASIHSHLEHSFIITLILHTYGSYVRAWIGLFDAIQEGRWMWTDGSKLDYTVWAEGEPNNAGGENCVEINFKGTDTWNDESCGSHRPFVCARRL